METGTAGRLELFRGVVHPWHHDHFGHMNVRHYAPFFDDATYHMWTLMGLPYSTMIPEHGVHTVTAEAKTRFIRELKAGDLIAIDGAVSRIGTRSTVFHLRMRHADTGALHATCDIVEVFFDPVARASAPMPEAVRARLAAHLLAEGGMTATGFAAAARAAAAEMRALFEPTPLMRNDFLSQRHGAEIWLKREDLSPVRSYKIRGAFNAMRKVLARDPGQRHFVCASAGNHAQGVAFVCRHFGVHGTIFMPVTTPQQKIGKTRAFGGDAVTIRLTGDYFDQSLAAAQAFCQAEGAHFLSPFDDEDVIEGQAGVAVEILTQLPAPPDLVILPVGGGGLSAGVTALLAAEAPATRFVYVEPAGGASLTAALAAGAPVTLPQVDSFVDGAAVARIGTRTFARLSAVDPASVLLAPENRICGTMLEMLNVEGIVLEPAGALAVDVLPELADRIAGRTVVCITSGGNFDFERLPEVKERAMRHAGVKKYFLLRLPQRPGALRDFLEMLGPDDDIARFEYLKKSARNFGTVLLGIETSAPANFAALQGRLTAAGYGFRDITEDDTLGGFVI